MSRSNGRPPSSASVPSELLDNRYRLESLLGRGGMGVVYKALDTRLDRWIAVKVLRPAEDADEQRFFAEVRILAGLNHANLVRLLDAGDFDGRPYLVMDLIDGPTLAQRLSVGGLTRQQSAGIGADVAVALAYVHDHAVVHRDVKPANVLLDAAGTAYLTDFGIARLVDTTGMTATGLTLGTPAYLAPEQVQGGAVSPAADVYALGLVLIECVTGRRAFEGTASEVAAARLIRDVEVPHDLGSDWEDVLSLLTRRDPNARMTATEAGAALSRLSEMQDASTAPLSSSSDRDDLTRVVVAPLGVATELLESKTREDAGRDGTLTSILLAPDAPRRRWRLPTVLVGCGTALALLVGLAAGGVFSPPPSRSGLGTTTSLNKPPATTSSTTTTASTTIPLPSPSAAALSLQSLLQAGTSAGSISYSVAQQLDQQLQPLLGPAVVAGSSQGIQAFDQFVQTFDLAVGAGTISGATTVANMTTGIATLAAALGTAVPTTTTTTTTTVAPGPGDSGSGNSGTGTSGSGNSGTGTSGSGNTGSGNSGNSGSGGNGFGHGHGH